MYCCLISSYPIIVPPHEPWPKFVFPPDQHSENPITEPSVMASMIPSAEHSENPSSLLPINPLYPTNQAHALLVHKKIFKNKLHTIPNMPIRQRASSSFLPKNFLFHSWCHLCLVLQLYIKDNIWHQAVQISTRGLPVHQLWLWQPLLLKDIHIRV